MKIERDIQNMLSRLTDLKKHPEVWTDAELTKLFQVVHVLDTRVYEANNTVYTKAEIDYKLDKIRGELEYLKGRA